MNWDKIEQLLKIAEVSVKWPSLRPIHDAAMKELGEHAMAPVPNSDVPEAEPETESLKRKKL
jgi:hypothetical protein